MFKRAATVAGTIVLTLALSSNAHAEERGPFQFQGVGVTHWDAFSDAWIQASQSELIDAYVELFELLGFTVVDVSIQIDDWDLQFSSPIHVGVLTVTYEFTLRTRPGPESP